MAGKFGASKGKTRIELGSNPKRRGRQGLRFLRDSAPTCRQQLRVDRKKGGGGKRGAKGEGQRRASARESVLLVEGTTEGKR